MINPLIPSLLARLKQQLSEGAGGLSAYDLLTELGEHPAFSLLDSSPKVKLFQKNFLLMNALFQLQAQLWLDEKIYLSVSVLNIELHSSVTGLSDLNHESGQIQGQLDSSASVREYYLDWGNFEQREEDVEKLLNSFWALFEGSEQRQMALKLLGLNANATLQQIKQRYRVLAARHHPDKGGDAIRFIEIKQAYETLLS